MSDAHLVGLQNSLVFSGKIHLPLGTHSLVRPQPGPGVSAGCQLFSPWSKTDCHCPCYTVRLTLMVSVILSNLKTLCSLPEEKITISVAYHWQREAILENWVAPLHAVLGSRKNWLSPTPSVPLLVEFSCFPFWFLAPLWADII